MAKMPRTHPRLCDSCCRVPEDVALDPVGVLTTVSEHVPVMKKVSGHVQSEIKAAVTSRVLV